jgi:hypothetical protein
VELWSAMGSVRYLFLRSIGEPADNVLSLVLQEGWAAEDARDVQIGHVVLPGVRDISCPEGSAVYEVVFSSYVAYSVRNESFMSSDPEERYEGQRCRVYAQAKLFDYVAAATTATSEYPGEYVHYELVCENHIIDVATVGKPEVRRVGGAA